MLRHEDRLGRFALAASFVLHGMALLSCLVLPQFLGGRDAADKTMMVDLVFTPPPPAAEPPSLQTELPVFPEPVAPQKVLEEPVPPSPVAKRILIKKPAPPDNAAKEAQATVEAKSVVNAPTQAAIQTVAQDIALAVREAELRAYSEAVWKHILRHKPATAREPGTVTLRFLIAHDGSLLRAEVAVSSGFSALDELGIDTVRRAAPFPPPPQTADAPLLFNLPFQFR